MKAVVRVEDGVGVLQNGGSATVKESSTKSNTSTGSGTSTKTGFPIGRSKNNYGFSNRCCASTEGSVGSGDTPKDGDVYIDLYKYEYWGVGANPGLYSPASNLPDCLGYAMGRYAEILCDYNGWTCNQLKNSEYYSKIRSLWGDAADAFSRAQSVGLPTTAYASNVMPYAGDIIVFDRRSAGDVGGENPHGHVIIVESINANSLDNNKDAINLSEGCAYDTMNDLALDLFQYKTAVKRKYGNFNFGNYGNVIGYIHQPWATKANAGDILENKYKVEQAGGNYNPYTESSSYDAEAKKAQKEDEKAENLKKSGLKLRVTETYYATGTPIYSLPRPGYITELSFAGGSLINVASDFENIYGHWYKFYVDKVAYYLFASDNIIELSDTNDNVELITTPIETRSTSDTRDTEFTGGLDLVADNNRISMPYVMVKMGDYQFGGYSKEINKSAEDGTSYVEEKFPNYIKGLKVKKINGSVNTYTLDLEYLITEYNDPNFFEKIFSQVGVGGYIYFTYGDCLVPTYMFKEEAAVITDIKTNGYTYAGNKLSYTITAQGVGAKTSWRDFVFPAQYNINPGEFIVNTLLSDETYGLLEIYPGMKDKQKVISSGLIPTDGVKEIDLVAKANITIFEYLQYIVDNMVSIDGKKLYKLVTVDDISDEYHGQYFKIVGFSKDVNDTATYDMYQLKIGYPDTTAITNFSITSDLTPALYTSYADSVVDDTSYKGFINDNGELEYRYVPSILERAGQTTVTQSSKNWFASVTSYPVTAKATIRGLLRPSLLMQYLQVSVYYFGKKHTSSGIYVITEQTDTLQAGVYQTDLSLLRIKGDEGYSAAVDIGQKVANKANWDAFDVKIGGSSSNSTTTVATEYGEVNEELKEEGVNIEVINQTVFDTYNVRVTYGNRSYNTDFTSTGSNYTVNTVTSYQQLSATQIDMKTKQVQNNGKADIYI